MEFVMIQYLTLTIRRISCLIEKSDSVLNEIENKVNNDMKLTIIEQQKQLLEINKELKEKLNELKRENEEPVR